MSDHATETPADIAFNQAGDLLHRLRQLQRDVEAGKTPPTCRFPVLRYEFGQRVTMKLVKERLHHLSVSLAEHVQALEKLAGHKPDPNDT